MPWKCFWLEPTRKGERSLRRWSSGSSCGASGLGYHNSSKPIGTVRLKLDKDGSHRGEASRQTPHADKRWPKRCACGYRFTAKDSWQDNIEQLYERTDTGALTTLRDAPIGAMWDATWFNRHLKPKAKPGDPYCGPDGKNVVVKTPGGDWMMDGPAFPKGATQGTFPAWTRSGIPPELTVSPSISIGDPERYHGFLGSNGAAPGYLSDDLSGKTYG